MRLADINVRDAVTHDVIPLAVVIQHFNALFTLRVIGLAFVPDAQAVIRCVVRPEIGTYHFKLF